MRRAALGGRITLGYVLSGLVHRRIDTCEAYNGTAAWKAVDIANLSYQLWSSLFAHTVHGPDGIILRELPDQTIHLRTHNSKRGFGGGRFLCGGSK